ncbi:DUF3887 domain-containing protein [Paenibacillus sp. IB182496]|uniref:DUF3887 domain-containing protein n=1 Tax=Paenibacillus sabuli TaxID=2772509 RepID=A0A927BUI8_9BACL|nr:DUF3887 domain-containing protein [Paenibacillus sabuli]MBD2846577.1 DUF3887 domain-containing protein [Paenibacillus sabuli]
MKKTAALTLSFLLVLTMVPMLALAEFKPVAITIDGERVRFPDAQPYADGETVMLPIRFVAEHLSVAIRWNGAAREVELAHHDQVHVLRLQDDTVAWVGSPNTYAAAMKKGRVYVPHSAISDLFGYEADYDPAAGTVAFVTTAAPSPQQVQLWADEVIQAFLAGQFDAVYDRFDAALADAVSREALQTGWEAVSPTLGEFEATTVLQQAEVDGLHVAAGRAAFSEQQLKFQMAFHADGRLASISFSPLYDQPAAEAPTGVQEEPVALGEDTDYPLEGTLTLPADASGAVPAVILVHGSGPSDRDGTVFAYTPYRDIAWSLAEQGIAVLRYDKRTYAYGQQLAQSDMRTFTVAEETVEDAVQASDWLKQDARIDAAGGDFAGLILFAGTPRTLWEVMYDQNVDAIAAMDIDEDTRAAYLEAARGEYERASHLQELTDEEAQQSTIFGLPAYYIKEMDRYDAAAIAAELHKPILILQGETDFQVKADVDYVLWQERLAGVEDVTFARYPGLNHFFIASEGDAIGTTAEYQIPGHVDEGVLQDIAAWIGEAD